MTKSEKEKMLNRYSGLEYRIQELDDLWEELYTESTKITPSYSTMGSFGGGFDGSKVENACIKLLEIDLKRDSLKNLKQKIEAELKKLTYHQRKVVEFIAVENHTIYQASKFFKQTYTNTKVSYFNALDKLNFDI